MEWGCQFHKSQVHVDFLDPIKEYDRTRFTQLEDNDYAESNKYYVRRLENILCNFDHCYIPVGPTNLEGRVYIGLQADAENKKRMESAGFTHVVNFSPENMIMMPNGTPMRPYNCRNMGLKDYLEVYAVDERGGTMGGLFRPVVKWIRTAVNAGGKVLLVSSGPNRCGAFSLAYLIGGARMRLIEAAKILKGTRRVALSNVDILYELVKYAKDEDRLDPTPSAAMSLPKHRKYYF